MASQTVARFGLALTFLGALAAAPPASAQTSLGHGQHVAGYGYGSGYVGNAPNSIPMTSYYRSPAITAYSQPAVQQPVTSYYAPSGVVPAGYSPAVSYRVGTPNAAAYSSAFSPIVTPTTPYAANWQYPPQTVMPTVANYAPVPPAYTTNYANVPVTYYRPVTVLSPAGTPQTVLQPCTGSECQAQRNHSGMFGWLFHHKQAAAAPCTSGYCGQPAPAAVPYYTPGPAVIGTPLGSSSTSIPANVAPTLSGPPVVSGGSTIVPNTSVSPGITVAPGTTVSPGTALPPTTFGSGAARADYPPADAYCPPPSTTSGFAPNVSAPATAPAPAGEVRPIVIPPPPETKATEPADAAPALNGPSNAPVGNGLQENSDSRVRQPSRQFPVETQQHDLRGLTPHGSPETQHQPGAVIRRDNNITPIPDPEYTNGTRAKVNKAPQLLKPSRDRTARVTPSETRLAAFEEETQPVEPAAAAPRKVLGDEIWRSAK